MHQSPQPFREKPGNPIRRLRRTAGFTLVEVMMATIVFVAAGLGIYTVLIHAYQVVALTRYHDDARAVLQTFASQFLHLQSSTLDGQGTPWSRVLFSPIGIPTGAGLLWDSTATPIGPNTNLDSLSNEPGTPTSPAPNTSGNLIVIIGGQQNGIPAQVTRFVQQLKSDGTPSSTTLPPDSAGMLLIATFTINYGPLQSDPANPMSHYIYGSTVQQCTQSITVMRSAP